MTIGSKVGFPGEAVPAHGNSVIMQSGSTAVDIVTITMATGVDSSAGADALVVSRYDAAEGGPQENSNVFCVDYTGTRGMRHVKALPVSATTYTVSASESGCLFTVAAASAIVITLPTAAPGLEYEFLQVGTCASGFLVQGATGNMMIGFNDVGLTSIEVGTSAVGEGGGLRVVGNTNVWYCITEPAFTSVAPTTASATYYTLV